MINKHKQVFIGIFVTLILIFTNGCEKYSKNRFSDEKQLSHLNKNYDPALIWTHMRTHFTIYNPRIPLHPRVQQLAYYYSHPQRQLDALSARAAPYLHYIVQELERREMPVDLALIPLVESGFEPKVISCKGATGIWQIMPATGKTLGLKRDVWHDGHKDIISSTTAALDYLQYLNKEFNGNWYQSIAAYNAGGGAVARAIKNNKALNKSTDVWDLKLPKQTQDFLAKTLAFAELIYHPNYYSARLTPIYNKPYLKKMVLKSNTQFKDIARLTGLSVIEIQNINPGFKQALIPPGKDLKPLLLPVDKASLLEKKLAELYLPIAKPKLVEVAKNTSGNLTTIKQSSPHLKNYIVQKNDSLSHIATLHKTTIKMIKDINQLKTDLLRPGDVLQIPREMAKITTENSSLNS
ncbi:MAG: Lytic transglycosylase, catalytic [Francisellaceae bacterium]|nr:Lytic transglycosylase, catalytic [Francisellaceae bacterium]